jgi:hypothetical protein
LVDAVLLERVPDPADKQEESKYADKVTDVEETAFPNESSAKTTGCAEKEAPALTEPDA